MPNMATSADRYGKELIDDQGSSMDDDDDDDDSSYQYVSTDDDSDVNDINDAGDASTHSDANEADDASTRSNDQQPMYDANDDNDDNTTNQSVPSVVNQRSGDLTGTHDNSDQSVIQDNDDSDNGTNHDAVSLTDADDDYASHGNDNQGIAGVDLEATGVRELPDKASVIDMDDDLNTDIDRQYRPRNHNINLRPRKMRNYDHRLGHTMATSHDPLGMLFLTKQMSLRKGLWQFGADGAKAVIKELQQLHYREVIEPVKTSDMTGEQRRRALNYLMYLKQKRCSRIKARGCADGRKQQIYKTKDETRSPTVYTESVFLTSVIDAMEGRKVVTVDIPGAFMHSDMDEIIHMRLDGPMAELLVKVDKDKYQPFLKTINRKKTLFVKLSKALYGTLQAALLFWKNLSSFLVNEMGFELNPYDQCVANKVINGKHCTIIWHVDDLKMSHLEQSVLEEIIVALNKKYGKETPITVHWGDKHDYLGMIIDYSHKGKVIFTMDGAECPSDMDGTAVTPAANHLFEIKPSAVKLTTEKSEQYHHITARQLYLSKRIRPDLQTCVSYLTTRVQEPNEDDWTKLSRCVKYLRGTKSLGMTLEADKHITIKWWIDALFAVHPDM